jgi:tetratricopeptide (TPR) repeat protein
MDLTPAARKEFERAVALSNQGQLATAEGIVKELEARHPRDVEVAHFGGVLANRMGRYDVAVQRLARCVQLQPRRAKAHAALAFALEQLGRLEEARDSFDAAIRAEPGFAQAYNGKGVVLVKLGDPSAALPYFDRAIALDASSVEPRLNAAHALLDQGSFERAARLFRDASGLARSDAVLRTCATGLYQSDDLAASEAILAAMLRRNPSDSSARALLALIFDSTGREGEALAAVEAIRASGIGDAAAENACGIVLMRRNRFDEAAAHFRKALALDPGLGEAVVNLSTALSDAGREEESRAEMQAMESRLDAIGLARLAALYSRIGDSAKGIELAERAIASSAHLHNAHATLATQLLRTGQLERGWREYLYRPTRGEEIVERVIHGTYPPPLPPNLAGRDVLILSEQGLGDVLFFLRYAKPLADAGAKLHTMRLDPKIASIVTRALPIDVWSEDHPLASDTMLVYAGDLPCFVRPLTGGDVSSSLSVAPLPERVARMRERFGNPEVPRIGVAWRAGTSPAPSFARRHHLWKDIAPTVLGEALAGLPFEFVSLQRKPADGATREFESALGAKVIDCAAVNDDLEDMLALLSLLDGYAGVSSTNIHLLAALGRRGRILVPHPPEWRWQAAGQSPWFGDFDIYRQAADGGWNEALARLRQDLIEEKKA